MTPRQKSEIAWTGVIITGLVALGGLYGYASSRESKIAVLQVEVDTVKNRLDRIERQNDEILLILKRSR